MGRQVLGTYQGNGKFGEKKNRNTVPKEQLYLGRQKSVKEERVGTENSASRRENGTKERKARQRPRKADVVDLLRCVPLSAKHSESMPLARLNKA